jgi:FKBP-type peptidyl-prolyl cis-trans isomerase FkpA
MKVPAHRLHPLLLCLLGGVSLLGLACAKLTAPPEQISTDTTTAASAPAAAAQPRGSGQPKAAPTAPPTAPLATAQQPDAKVTMQDLVVGKGQEAKTGDVVSVHYVGTLTDGKEFDQSRKRGQPFTFPLGQGRVIKGWDQGVVGMKVGGKRKLTIPPSLGYGERGAGAIPPNSTLVFEVELLEIKK